MKELLDLFVIFFRIGIMTFGGGYAMLPILQKELVEKRKWVTNDEIADYFAIGQCTPGIIAVNTATFIGYKRKGTVGGIAATLGVVAPSVVIICIIAAFLKTFADIKFVQDAFSGIRVCVCVLIVNTIIKLWKSSIKNAASFIIFLIVLGVSLFTNVSSVILVIAAGLTGLVIGLVRKEAKQ